MANICEKVINACIAASCDNPIFEGAEAKAYIFNKSEIASFTFEDNNPNVITAINMATYEDGSDDVNYVGYTINQLGRTPYTGTNTALVEGNIANKWTETVNFVVPDNSPLAAGILDNIGNGKFVVVIENQYDGSDGRGKYQVYGVKKGLVCTEMTRELYSDDTDSAWSITLTSENCPNSAIFVEHKTGTDVDTKEYLDSLVDCGE